MATKSPKTTAKAPAMETTYKSKSGGEDMITIELQHLLTPAAILLSGMMISATLFFSIKNYVGGNVLGATNNDTTTTETAPEEEFADATTTIDDDPIIGDKKKAKIAIVEFSDFECPYCQQHFQNTHKQIVENFVDTGDAILVYRDLPLSFHPLAQPAALSANCVKDQKGDEGFFSYHDKIFEVGLTSEDQLTKYAEELSLNMSEFNACVSEERFADEVSNDSADATSAGIGGTPGFVIGVLKDDGTVEGIRVPGAYPYSQFETLINQVLAEA